jgi:hypothetical protein
VRHEATTAWPPDSGPTCRRAVPSSIGANDERQASPTENRGGGSGHLGLVTVTVTSSLLERPNWSVTVSR